MNTNNKLQVCQSRNNNNRLSLFDPFKGLTDSFFGGSLFQDDWLDLYHNEQETEDSLVLSFDLPGYKKEEIDISINQGYLQVTAKNDSRGTHTTGRTISAEIEPDKTKAELNDGILRITLFKSEKSKPIKIKIE